MAKLTIEALAHSAAALQSRDFKAALDVRDREYGPGHGTFDDCVVRTMELILSRTPALLSDCPPEILEPLRVAAAMMELWGVSGIRQFVSIDGELDYHFEPKAIANMLHSHACFLRSLEGFRRSGITTVKLLGSGNLDDCEACRAADGGIFTIDTVPELPLATCRCETGYGCRVIVIAHAT
jgi:hypothetical protein